MFEKITRKLTKGAMEDAKRTIKEEAFKYADDLLPTVVGVASIVLLIFASVPPQKALPTQIIVNNYYFRR